MSQPVVILFRAAAEADPFAATFAAAGWQVINLPVLDFSFVNEVALHTTLADRSLFDGLIITSPRAAKALARACEYADELMATCRQLDVVCTGEKTAAPLVDVGLNPQRAAAANAEAVAKHVIAMGSQRTWLFLCGNLRRPELPAMLSEAGIPFSELEVYQTTPRTNLQLDTYEKPDWVGFFSPSGVDCVQKAWPTGWKEVKKAAIGNTTADALRAVNWAADAVAAVPEGPALHAAIEEAMQQKHRL